VPIIDKVLQRSEFNSEPPLLIDVGASGGLHPAWKALAKYSVCIAFDADSREMRMAPRASTYIGNCISTIEPPPRARKARRTFTLQEPQRARACFLRAPRNSLRGNLPSALT